MSLILSSCAFGPLVTHETARSLGSGNHDLLGGYGSADYVIKWNVGLSENWDMGIQYESLSLGLRFKYAVINNKENGFSLAGALGIGSSLGGSHYYGDIMTSYLTGWWEPYSNLRLVHVTIDPIDFGHKDNSVFDFTIPRTEYSYGQFFLGSRFWIHEHWTISVEASTLFGITSGIKYGHNVLAGVAVGYRFF